MVRSKKKSAPISLYNAKKYRAISQRRMTTSHCDIDPRKDDDDDDDDENGLNSDVTTNTATFLQAETDLNNQMTNAVTAAPSNSGIDVPTLQLLSDELMNEYESNEMVITTKHQSKKASQSGPSSNVQLTTEEIRLGQQQRKQTQRKLQQLQQRQQQKQLRQQLYTSLQHYSIVKPSTPPPTTTIGRTIVTTEIITIGEKEVYEKGTLAKCLTERANGYSIDTTRIGFVIFFFFYYYYDGTCAGSNHTGKQATGCLIVINLDENHATC
jgi:hypothetical protein